MRRARHKLQVSTFPFLAVLLGAMGALILLLLVMDRRSKIVARAKAIEAHAAQLAVRAKMLSHRHEDEEAARAEWECKRQELHDLLRAQEQDVNEERQKLDAKLQGLDQVLGQERKTLTELERSLLEERAKLDVKSQLLAQMSQGIARSAKLDAASRLEVEKLARDLSRLERALAEAVKLKSQEHETYSLVPYRGKLGEGRRPVYVECTADGLIFHPERRRMDNAAFDIRTFRNEIQERGIELVREKREPDRPSRPPQPKIATNPYVLFLVRPDGLESYYNATTALRGFDLDFGYEFVDAQWVLDFSTINPSGAAKAAYARRDPPASQPRAEPLFGYAASGYSAPGSPPMAIGAGGSGSGQFGGGASANGRFGTGPATSASAHGGAGNRLVSGTNAISGSRGGPSSGASFQGGAGNGPWAPPAVANDAGSPAGDARPGLGLSVSNGSSIGSGPGGNTSAPRTTTGLAGPGTAGTGDPTIQQTGQAKSGEGVSQDVAWRGSPTSATPGSGGSSQAGMSAGTGTPTGGPRPLTGLGSPSGDSSGGIGQASNAGDSGSIDPLARLAPKVPFADPRPGPKKPAPAPTVGRLLANRDYVLTIECFGDAAALYPSSQVFSVANGANQKNIDEVMVQAVLQLIARRQATVRAGETPYRPMLRFQVHPEALRTYYHVYPLFEHLRIPMARENLDS